MNLLRNNRAFTLIEMLVAMAVLALLALFITQLIDVSSIHMSASSRKLDGLAGARFALDRLGSDLAAMVQRSDVGQNFQKQAGNDTLAFYSEVDAYSGTRRLAAVAYRIQETNTDHPYQLERGVLERDWGDNFPTAAPSVNALDYDVLAEGVLRMEFGYLTKKGQLVSNQTILNSKDVSAVVVAVAVLDSGSRKMLTDTQIKALATALSDPLTPGSNDLISGWESALASSGLAPQAVQNVRFFQRYYYVR